MMREFRVKNTPPPGHKRVGDWKGMRVRTKRDMKNGWGVIPAGSLAVVDHIGNGFDLKFDVCPCCGLQAIISRITSADIEPIENVTASQAAQERK